MSDVDKPAKNSAVETEPEKAIDFSYFLERIHPSVTRHVEEFWIERDEEINLSKKHIKQPEIRLYCRKCEGERTFRTEKDYKSTLARTVCDIHPQYTCGDCQSDHKRYALHIEFGADGNGQIYKYGEIPPFGVPVPNRILRLFGKIDSELFIKGRQCESRGYGIAAFAYYRRVVENRRNDLFDEIIKACETVNAPRELIKELGAAKKEISFSKSMEKIKIGLPDGLLISGQNPLLALHKALSVGLHSKSDKDCLEDALSVRIVLTELVDRIVLLKQEKKQVADAVHRLLGK